MLADMVRTDSHQLRPVAGDSAEAEAIEVVTQAHKALIWERTRHAQRLRHALRDYFPAALQAFEDLAAADTLELLAKAPDPASAAKLTIGQISAALKRARRQGVTGKAAAIQAALRTAHLGRPTAVTAAYAATVGSAVAVLTVLGEQIKALQGQVGDHFDRHPAAEIVLSQPGLGPVLGTRVLAEFGDPEDQDSLRRGNRLVTPHQTPCRLTPKLLGCLCGPPQLRESGAPLLGEKGWRLNMSTVQRSASPFISVSSALFKRGRYRSWSRRRVR